MTDEDQETITMFLEESFEGLGRAETLLLEIEKGVAPGERLNALFRDLHTIKGTSSFLEFRKIESLAHATEDLLGKLRDGTLRVSSEKITVVLEVVDVLRSLMTMVKQVGHEGDATVDELVTRVRAQMTAGDDVPTADAPARAPARIEILIAHEDAAELDRLTALLLPHNVAVHGVSHGGAALGQMRGLRPGDPAPTAELALISATVSGVDGIDLVKRYFEGEKPQTKAPCILLVKSKEEGDVLLGQTGTTGIEYVVKPTDGAALAEQMRAAIAHMRAEVIRGGGGAAVEETTIRVAVSLLDQLMNLVGELVLARNQILQVASSDKEGRVSVAATAQRLNIVTSELQQQVMRTRMQPVARLFDQIPRIVRNISRATAKDVVCHIEGNTTELDRTFIELLRDPLMHIVRNSIDHGIEPAEARRSLGKAIAGSLRVRAYHEGGSVNIEIEDDGQGLDPKKLRARAVEKELMSYAEAAQLSDREVIDVIFLPGFSTAEKVTAVSGRGVGMDVVRTQVERAGGQVELTSVVGRGTTVRLKIPLTLAIVPALLVRNAGLRFAIPQINVVELVHLSEQQATDGIEKLRGAEVYRLRGTMLPLLRLSKVLKTPDDRADPSDGVNIIVVAAGDRKYGLLVDGVQDTIEIVVKPMHRQLKRLNCYSGATVLGDGSLALILDVLGIAACANMKVGSGRATAPATSKSTSLSQSETLLIFRAGDAPCAVPLSMISRIEQVPRDKIEWVAGREVLQYRNTIMPIVRPEGQLGLGATSEIADQPVIVFDFGRPIGFAVNAIHDILEVDASAIRSRDASPGVLGSMVMLGKTTLLLDVFSLVKTLAPTFANEGGRQTAPHRALVVDDSLMMRTVIASYLRSCGYDPVAVGDADAATAMLESATQAGQPFAAILTDVEMPGTDGLAMIRRLRARPDYANLPIIVVTQHREAAYRERAMAVGATAFVTKLDRAELEAAVAKWMPETGRKAA